MTLDVYEELRREALAQIDGTGVDPETQLEEVRELLEVAVEDYQRRAHLGDGRSLADPQATVERYGEGSAEAEAAARRADQLTTESFDLDLGDIGAILTAQQVADNAELVESLPVEPATEG